MADVVTGLKDDDMDTVGLRPSGSDTPLGTDADESDADADQSDADADESDTADSTDTADTTDGDTSDSSDGDTADA